MRHGAADDKATGFHARDLVDLVAGPRIDQFVDGAAKGARIREATSAVMELCLDNPREGFSDLFATHPSVQSRIDALVKFAGGHDPGPLPPPADETEQPATDEPEAQGSQQDAPPPLPKGPWNDAGGQATPPPVPAPSPSGTAAANPSANPLGSPIGNPMGPWGRH